MKKYNITVNGNTYEVLVEEVDGAFASPAPTAVASPIPTPTVAPTAAPAAPKTAVPKATATTAGATKITAPMPGTIIQVKVSNGQTVKKGDVICVLEAMKMENDIPAPCDGTIATINVQKGASINAGDIIATLN